MTLTPTITDFALSLKGADPVVGQQLTSSGWYYDPVTGKQYYYNALQNQWYIYVAGYLYALGYMNPAPKTVTLAPGEKLKMTLSFKYTGVAVTGVSARYCIGVYGAAGFDEKVYATTTFNIPANLTTTPITVTNEATLTLPTTGVGSDWNDIYVKIWGGTPSIGGSELSPNYIFGYENALVLVGLTPTITEFKILDFTKVT
jgi:hypothetical protein